ncbi:hypothetical protein SLEP1_g29725 [Rubroshorea leprosula]|uniref:Inhibitor of growth protein N-terminal histone-binding domain-containing protein n=1 Tax=Rubroshorea leprosula TaxID=152421 RepID=A0AAV5JXU8_9ROSI|nr:hypothetical protein SLEP1_g29725 [Rubroshorea leprosula]
MSVAMYLESLPNILQKKYALIRDLDKSLQEIVRQNEQRCEQEIEDIKNGVRAGNITPDTSLIRFSDEALDEQKHSIRIADEKVALAVQAYDLVDTHIQQLDQYLKRFDEELWRERENAAAAAAAAAAAVAVLPATSLDGSVKCGRSSEGGRGGRKKYPLILDILIFGFLMDCLNLFLLAVIVSVDSCFRLPEEVIFSITCASCLRSPQN